VDRQVDIKGEYPWEQLRGTVLDVGGGSGHVSMALAKVRTVNNSLQKANLASGIPKTQFHSTRSSSSNAGC
jgi:hypothetical protein